MWRLEGNFTNDTTEAGMGKSGTIRVRYTSTDPSNPQYSDDFDVHVDKSGLWPVPEVGPTPEGLHGETKKFYDLGQVMARHVGELRR
jgi:hypothetical protein